MSSGILNLYFDEIIGFIFVALGLSFFNGLNPVVIVQMNILIHNQIDLSGTQLLYLSLLALIIKCLNILEVHKTLQHLVQRV